VAALARLVPSKSVAVQIGDRKTSIGRTRHRLDLLGKTGAGEGIRTLDPNLGKVAALRCRSGVVISDTMRKHRSKPFDRISVRFGNRMILDGDPVLTRGFEPQTY
jgi:hypothetical protein